MKWILTYIFVSIIFFPYVAIAQSCDTAMDCNSKGTKLYSRGKYVQAIKYFEKQADLATGKEDKKNIRIALNNLALANLKIGNVLLANAWIQVSKEFYDGDSDKSTIYNCELIEKELRKISIPPAITGTYNRYAGYGRWNTLEIVELKKETLKVHLYVQRYGFVESAEESGPAAYWDLFADGSFEKDNIEIKYEGIDAKECSIKMTRKNIKIVAPDHKLAERCEVGGYNTYVHGTYWLTDTRRPLIQKQ